MSLLATERALYQDVWTSLEHYRDHAPGEARLPMFLESAQGRRGTVLDAGTGSGKGALALKAAGFDVFACDVTNAGMVPEARDTVPFCEACLWHDLRPLAAGVGHPNRTTFDFVYCCDVLEHVPPQFTMLAIDQMLRVSRIGLFLTVSLVPDNFGVWLGKALHQTVQPYTWWRDSLRELGALTDARDLISDAVFFVEPKR